MIDLLKRKMVPIATVTALLPAAAFATGVNPNRQPPRTRINLNEEWRFKFGRSVGASERDFDDSAWPVVSLPHTWNAEDLWDDEPGYTRGEGWYRKRLIIPERLRQKRLFLHFEGANEVAEVFLNGHRLGAHEGGYTAFAFDITESVDWSAPGDANALAVRADNSFNENIPPLTADFTFYGGIYRDAWLIATNPVHFEMLDHASPGIRIDTPRVKADEATVRVRGVVANESKKPGHFRVVSTVRDADAVKIARMETAIQIPAGERVMFSQESNLIARPHLWSPGDPYLYTVDTEVFAGTTRLDAVTHPLGFRWFAFDANRGFSLNGQNLKLIGTNRHQDHAGLGNALPNALHVRDLEIIKDMGLNFLRLAHYPQDPAVLDAADRLGLIIWEEIPIVNYVTPSDAFVKNSGVMLTEMIRQHYNHPSILMWGYMNEVLLYPESGKAQRQPMTDAEYFSWVAQLARGLDRLCRKEDPSRVTVMAGHGSELYDKHGLAAIPQVLGWNLYHGWYVGTFKTFGEFLDKQHEEYPDRSMIVSEYGAGSDLRLHSVRPTRFDFTTEWQQLYHESHLDQIASRPFVAGSALWNQFDFGVESRGDSIPHLNQKGVCLYDRRPKDLFYFYKARGSPRPVLHIAVRDWQERAAIVRSLRERVTQPVCVYSNIDEVELLCKGQSLGRKQIGRAGRARWNVPFGAGLNRLTARGSAAGQPIEDQADVGLTLATLSSFDELAVNVGAEVQFRDMDGRIWLADQPYSDGGWGHEGGKSVGGGAPNIRGTNGDPLFQSYRRGLTAYRFDVPDSVYEIELRFAEREVDQVGSRVFLVRINDNTEPATTIDLVKQAGPRTAAARNFRVRASDGAGVRVAFESVAGEAVLSAIRLERMP